MDHRRRPDRRTRDDIGVAQPFCRCRQRRLVAGMDQRQGLLRRRPRRRSRAPRVSPTAWSTAWPACRRPPPSSTTARPSARASTACTRPAAAGAHRPHERCPRQMAPRAAPGGPPARPARAPCARTARPRHPRRVPPPPRHGRHRRRRRGRPGPAPRRTAPASPRASRGSRGLALEDGDASATSTALPAVRPRHWSMSVSRATVGRPAPWATSTMLRASARGLLVASA